ncbi:MAG: outer membrane beta-barrel protein [Bryobacterales bacterium]|nr:outer membrane beta-barrel protein [Bryobacterales bacterium]
MAYRFNPRWVLGSRFEYLDDRHGLFSGMPQALKDNTIALRWQPAPGFQFRGEWRRDYSNRRFFPGRHPGRLESQQTAVTLGLLWRSGVKGGFGDRPAPGPGPSAPPDTGGGAP